MNKTISLSLLIVCACALVRAFPSVEEDECDTNICELPMEQGNCRASMRRWWYDMETKKCVPFKYGGCSGNANNFMSRRECMAACKGV